MNSYPLLVTDRCCEMYAVKCSGGIEAGCDKVC